MSDDKKMADAGYVSGTTTGRTGSGRDDTYESTKCCADCGASAVYDGRDEYTLCNCYSSSPWVNDGRGGYHTGGQIVTRDDDHR